MSQAAVLAGSAPERAMIEAGSGVKFGALNDLEGPAGMPSML